MVSKTTTVRTALLSAALVAALLLGFADTKAVRGVLTGWLLQAVRPGDPAMVRSQRYLRRQVIPRRDPRLSPDEHVQIMGLWHQLWIWDDLHYLGVHIQKNPMDLWMMQQLIYEVRPDVIVETGSLEGGSALYWAHILDGMGLTDSRVITIDIENRTHGAASQPLWQRYVEFIHADSVAPSTIAQVRQRVGNRRVLVVLDSLHTRDHVLREMELYGELVAPGSYMVVEDTNIDAIPVLTDYGAGPMAAVIDYLENGGDRYFEQDFSREAFIQTYNPGGWLRRKTE